MIAIDNITQSNRSLIPIIFSQLHEPYFSPFRLFCTHCNANNMSWWWGKYYKRREGCFKSTRSNLEDSQLELEELKCCF